MWRPLARRALLHRCTAAPELRLPVDLQVVIRPPSSNESASRSFLASSISTFHQNPRLFSSNSAEDHKDLPSDQHISEVKETTGGFDFSGMNAFGGDSKSEFENENDIFGGVTENVERDKGFGVTFDASAALGGNLESVEEIVEEAMTDKEKVEGSLPLLRVEDLVSLLQSSDMVDGSIESHLEGKDLVWDEEFVLKVLETPSVPPENLMSFFKWVMKNPDFKLTKKVLDVLVGVICTQDKKRAAYALWDLVNEVGVKEMGMLSTESLNGLIAVFGRLGKGKAAFDVFNKFEEFGCVTNADTYYLTIEALCKRSFYEWTCSVCEKMLTADMLPDDGEKVGKIISYLCKGGMSKDAHLVYLSAKDKKINLARSSINHLVCSLSRSQITGKVTVEEINKELDRETVSLALGMLNDYSAEDRKYATGPFSSVVKKLCWMEDIDQAKKLLLEMIHSGPPPGNALFNIVINGLTKKGDMEEAMTVMKLMESRGLKPDVYTYTVIMSGYVRSGDMEEACKIYVEAKQRHSKLTPVAYHSLIRGFCKLEQYDKAVNLLAEMRQHGIQPNHDEYNKLIKSLCLKALDWETAEKLEAEMRENGVNLNRRTSALITAVKELQEGESTEISAIS